MWFEKTATAAAVAANASRYQGVFFIWGSLVGVSPKGETGYIGFYNNTIYLPTSGGNWNPTPSTTGATYDTGGGPYTMSWSIIPHMHTKEKGGMGWNFVHNYPDFDNKKGDVCNYIDGAWRMPNAAEFGSVSDYGPWIAGTLPDANVNDEGTSVITAGREYLSAFGSAFFPVTGDRYTMVVDRGNYYSGTPIGNSGTYYVSAMVFPVGTGAVNPAATYDDTSPCAIRCIRKLATD
jgi:hypothetical protein